MDKTQWLKERKNYLGGTDVAAICKKLSYRTPLDVYLNKTSDEVADHRKLSDKEIKRMRRGTLFEDDVRTMYIEDTGYSVELEPNVLYHKEYKFLAANIDGWVNNKSFVFECKTACLMTIKNWGIEGTDQIPEAYLIQCAWYAAICEVPKVDLAVLIGLDDFRIYTYIRDKEFEAKLIKIACNFWYNNIQKRIAPRCSNLHDTSMLFPSAVNHTLVANDDINLKIIELKKMKQEETNLQKAIELLKVEIQEFMQDYDVLMDSKGAIIATWKNTSPKISFDTKKFKADCNEIYLKYVNHGKQSRIFLIK